VDAPRRVPGGGGGGGEGNEPQGLSEI